MNLQATAQVEHQSTPTISIKPTGGPLGADVIGFDMSRPATPEEQKIIEKAWADHLVLRIRGQAGLSLQHLTQFSSAFGQLDKRPVRGVIKGGAQNDLPPEITVISNIVVDGKPIGGLGAYEAVWHSDMTYKPQPPKGSCLYSVEIPPSGGGTSFANMYMAYERLPSELKNRIENLQCIHDASRNSTGELRQGFEEINDPTKTVGAVHPVVRTHPVTYRKCLFLGRRRNAYLVGLPLAESEALLDQLWQHATKPDIVWTQEWEVGDAVLWDNRCTMHRRDAFDPQTRRLMYRTQIAGGEVV
ncbi:MAG TPA: TauD/TfdA family dioxygenase [Eoetvoesiella sp.]